MKATVSPFSLLALVDSPLLHRSTACSFIHHRYPENLTLGPIPKRPRNRKIKVGYFSMDFCNHPTAHLTAELFENHDTQNFHITAFSYGRQTGDDMQTRLKQGFQAFFDVREKTDHEIAAMSRALGIDIAVDLAGHTHNARAGIFALRAAPIKFHFWVTPERLVRNIWTTSSLIKQSSQSKTDSTSLKKLRICLTAINPMRLGLKLKPNLSVELRMDYPDLGLSFVALIITTRSHLRFLTSGCVF